MTSTAATAKPSPLATSAVPIERSLTAKTLAAPAAARARPASTTLGGYIALTRERSRSREPTGHTHPYSSHSNGVAADELEFSPQPIHPTNGNGNGKGNGSGNEQSSTGRRVAIVYTRESTSTALNQTSAHAIVSANGSGRSPRTRLISAPSASPHHPSGHHTNTSTKTEQLLRLARNPANRMPGRELASPVGPLYPLDPEIRIQHNLQLEAAAPEVQPASVPAPVRFTALQSHIEAARLRHRAGRPSPSPSLSTISTELSASASPTPIPTPRGAPFTPSPSLAYFGLGHQLRPPQTGCVESAQHVLSPLARPDPSARDQQQLHTATSTVLLKQKQEQKPPIGECIPQVVESTEHQRNEVRWTVSDGALPHNRPHSSAFLLTPEYPMSGAVTPRRLAAPTQLHVLEQRRSTPAPLSAPVPVPIAAAAQKPTPTTTSNRYKPTTPRATVTARLQTTLTASRELFDAVENAAVEDSGVDASQSPSDADPEQSTNSLWLILHSSALLDTATNGASDRSGGTSAAVTGTGTTARASDTSSNVTGVTVYSYTTTSSRSSPATRTASTSLAGLDAAHSRALEPTYSTVLNSTVSLDALPGAIIVRVLAELDTLALVLCGGVCRHLRRLVWTTGSLWHTIRLSRATCGSSSTAAAVENASTLTAATVATMASRRSFSSTLGSIATEIDADRALEVVLARVCAVGELSGRHPASGVRAAHLSGCARLTDRGVGLLATHCAHSLRTLDVSRCPLVTNDALSHLLVSCPRLEAITATGNAQLKSLVRAQDVAFVACASSPSALRVASLTHVDLSECRSVDDDAVLELAAQCRALEHLFLRRCTAVGDAGLRAVSAYCARLRSISVCECVRVSDRSLVSLFAHPRRLEYVSIASCGRASDSSALALSRASSRLVYLNVRGLPLLSDRGLVALLERAPCLRSLDVGVGTRSTRYWARKADSAEAVRHLSAGQSRLTTITGQLHCAHCSVNTQLEAGGGALSDEDKRQIVEPAEPTFSDPQTASKAQCGALSLLSDDQSLYTYTYSCPDETEQQLQHQQQGVSDTSLVALAQHCPRLERLSLCGLLRVTDEGLRWLVSAATASTPTPISTAGDAAATVVAAHASPRSRLVYLDVRHCARVTPRGLRRVRALAPACLVEHTLLALSGWCEADELHERGLSGDGEGPEIVHATVPEKRWEATDGTRECRTGNADHQRRLSTRSPDERAETAQILVEVNV